MGSNRQSMRTGNEKGRLAAKKRRVVEKEGEMDRIGKGNISMTANRQRHRLVDVRANYAEENAETWAAKMTR
jgi:hypothetical protein